LSIFAVLGASPDTTSTLFELVGPKVPVDDPPPLTFTVSVMSFFSGWLAVKVHDAGVPLTVIGVEQVVLFMQLVPALAVPAPVQPLKGVSTPVH
jgi:hypothetical protein